MQKKFQFFNFIILTVLTFLIAGSLSAQSGFSTAGFFKVDGSGRDVKSFNNGWLYHKGDVPGGFLADCNDQNWQAVNVPHSLELVPAQASGGVNYQGPAWYRKHFRMPAELAGKKLMLHFEAVMGKCKVWINGQLVKEHVGGYLPVIIDVSNSVSFDGENTIAVWADNSDDGFYPPGKPQGALDFCYFGGIYRDVWLISTNPVHITDPNFEDKQAGGGVFVHFDRFSDKEVAVGVETDLRNETAQKQTVWVESVLKDRAGKTVGSTRSRLSLPPGGSVTASQVIPVAFPHLWDPDSPYLYDLFSQVMVGDPYEPKNGRDQLIDGFRTRVGIRKIEFKGKEGFFLNDKPYHDKLIGANRHQDYAYVGNALPNSGQWRDARKLRNTGMRIIRSAHYPQDPAFMDACDELGLFVIVATPGWQFWNNDPVFESLVYRDIRNMVRRDRNHASVIMWEPILNETRYPDNFARTTHELVHKEYPYQGAFTACDGEAKGHEFFDVLYTHPFNRLINDSKVEKGKNEADLQYAGYKTALFTREWGDNVDDWNSHNSPSRVARSWGEQAQQVQAIHYANPPYLFTCFETLYQAPAQLVGGCLWHPFDHQRGYHPDPFYGGILDVFRQPKYSFFLFESQRNPLIRLENADSGPMIYIANEMTPFSSRDVMVFTNCDQVRLIVNEQDTIIRNIVKTVPGMPHPIVNFTDVFDFMKMKELFRKKAWQKASLIAEGIIDGKVVAVTKRMPAKRPSKIILFIDNENRSLIADGSDFVPVIAAVTDNEGNIKRLNEYSIRFEVEGEGTVIGDESIGANPRKVEWGTAPVLIRSTVKPGKIKVRASVAYPGVNMPEAGEVEFESVPSSIALLGGIVPEIQGKDMLQKTVPDKRINTLQEELKKTRNELNQYKLKEVEKQQEDFEGKK